MRGEQKSRSRWTALRIVPESVCDGDSGRFRGVNVFLIQVQGGASNSSGWPLRFQPKRWLLRFAGRDTVGATCFCDARSRSTPVLRMPNGFAAFSKVPLSGWAQMVAFAGWAKGMGWAC